MEEILPWLKLAKIKLFEVVAFTKYRKQCLPGARRKIAVAPRVFQAKVVVKEREALVLFDVRLPRAALEGEMLAS
jgi:hypothetical protein